MRILLSDPQKPEVETALNWLQAQCLPGDAPLPTSSGHWWIARDGDVPIAFAVLTKVTTWERTAYMARAGVIRQYRGQGIQKKLLSKREQFAREHGYIRLISDTYRNPASANSLIRRGFKTYLPQCGWGASDTIYWLKELT